MALSKVMITILLAPAASFAPSPHRTWVRQGSAIRATETEEWVARAEAAYADAEAAVEKFGLGSKEARLAWEVVDDLENPSSGITAMLPKPLDEECDIELDEMKCRDFEEKLTRLNELAEAAKTINYALKYEVLKLENLKASTGVASPATVNSDAYKAAKSEAEAAAEKFGADSKEAKVAWETVFEIVSAADDDKVSMASLEDECLTSTSEKCKEYNAAMDQLKSVISGK
mmetsp:Transcript_7771/g.17734  ORF Transcript_7771/g.17734 Transcript_7771/m.17734 type:complete len:230 (-) Transcript_7771:305-994(-)